MAGRLWPYGRGCMRRIGGKALDCCPFCWRAAQRRAALPYPWPPMAASAAPRGPGASSPIACSFHPFSRPEATPARRPWAPCAGPGWHAEWWRPAWRSGVLARRGLAPCHAARRAWRRLAVWPLRALWHSRHSDVAKSRHGLIRGCDSRVEMIIVRQGLEALGARIGCFGFPSCRGQGLRINAGCSGNEEDLNA